MNTLKKLNSLHALNHFIRVKPLFWDSDSRTYVLGEHVRLINPAHVQRIDTGKRLELKNGEHVEAILILGEFAVLVDRGEL